MNGIEKITGRIEGDAQREIDGILADARQQAADLTARYTDQAQREGADLARRGEYAAAERGERLESVAQLEARKLVLAAKQEMLDKSFDHALQRLAELPDEAYIALLSKLALKATVTGREQVIFSQKDRNRVGKTVVTRTNEVLEKTQVGMLTLAESTRPMKGGIVLSDGEIETNCSFETLVRLLRDELSGEVARLLFQ